MLLKLTPSWGGLEPDVPFCLLESYAGTVAADDSQVHQGSAVPGILGRYYSTTCEIWEQRVVGIQTCCKVATHHCAPAGQQSGGGLKQVGTAECSHYGLAADCYPRRAWGESVPLHRRQERMQQPWSGLPRAEPWPRRQAIPGLPGENGPYLIPGLRPSQPEGGASLRTSFCNLPNHWLQERTRSLAHS